MEARDRARRGAAEARGRAEPATAGPADDAANRCGRSHRASPLRGRPAAVAPGPRPRRTGALVRGQGALARRGPWPSEAVAGPAAVLLVPFVSPADLARHEVRPHRALDAAAHPMAGV